MQELLALIVLSWATSTYSISTAINNSTSENQRIPQTGIKAVQISDVITVPGQEEVCIPFNITQPSIVSLKFNCSDLSSKITSTIDVKVSHSRELFLLPPYCMNQLINSSFFLLMSQTMAISLGIRWPMVNSLLFS